MATTEGRWERRFRSAAAILLVALAVAATVLASGCGSEERSRRGEKVGGDKASAVGAFGSYRAEKSLRPEEVVRAYVEAINERAGRRFCGLVAPYISGRFDLATRDPNDPIGGGCPRFVAGFIGYTEEAYQAKFKRAEIKAIEDPEITQGLMRVEARIDQVVSEQPDYAAPGPTPAGRVNTTRKVRDVIWLVRSGGAWRLAKLSGVARAASLALPYREKENPFSPPDPDVEQRRFEGEVRAFQRRVRERKSSYGSPGRLANCSGGVQLADRPDDLQEYRFPAPRTPIPRTPRADLRRVQVLSSNGRVCVGYEAAGDIEGPIAFTFSLKTGQARDGFLQVFEVDLRRGGDARVTSGEDDKGHPIAVPARVAIEGRRLSLVLDRQTFARSEPAPASTVKKPPLDRFAFSAAITAELSRRRTVNDPVDRGTRTSPMTDFTYPGGSPCKRQPGAPC